MAWFGTVRARTTLLASAVTGLALVTGSLLLLITLMGQLTSSGDALDQARMRDLLVAARAGNLPASIGSLTDDAVAQVLDARGGVLAASPNITGAPALIGVRDAAQPGVRTIEGPDDDERERYRIWVGSGPSVDGPVTVLVGTSLESVIETTRTVAGALVIGVPVLLALVAVAIWTFVGRALGRIDKITSAVDAIDQTELHRRVPVPAVADEVGRLADTMNRMLARLEESSRRQRVFVADASHDLQSPLAALRAQLEIALAHPGRVEVTTFARDLLANTTELEQLVRDLLYLAVQDDGGSRVGHALVDLDDVVLEEAARVRLASGIRVDTSAVSAAPMLGDPGDLRRLVRNLLDNAIRHAETRVTVSLDVTASGVVFEVGDDGPGVPATDRERVFDRFHRGDAARSRHGGSGLGLAIAQSVVHRHGGRIALLDSHHGARFEVRLPSIDQPARADRGDQPMPVAPDSGGSAGSVVAQQLAGFEGEHQPPPEER